MNRMLKLAVAIIAAVVITGCGNYKKVTYFQNIDKISLAASKGLYDARIMPKDLLTIYVSTIDPKVAQPFNLGQNLNSGGNLMHNSIQYLVDNEGCINFPVLGKLKVTGLTIRETEQLISDKIAPYLAEEEKAVVICRMASFRICILGETGSNIYTFDREKVSIVEAIAQAGDLTLYGKRQNILLIREDATGQKSIHRDNFNDAEIFNDPYYYLQQNDIIYVEPNKIKARTAMFDSSISYWLGLSTTIISFGTLLFTIFKK